MVSDQGCSVCEADVSRDLGHQQGGPQLTRPENIGSSAHGSDSSVGALVLRRQSTGEATSGVARVDRSWGPSYMIWRTVVVGRRCYTHSTCTLIPPAIIYALSPRRGSCL